MPTVTTPAPEEPTASRPRVGTLTRWAPWVGIVLAGGVLSAMSAPGQTAGLSVFTDPLIAELEVSRTAISVSYLIGTLVGAAALPFVGRALDRWGVRTATMIIGAAFAAFLLGLSFVGDLVGLTAGFIGVRMAGQGALSLAATTLVARTITHRRGLALGAATALGSGGISLAPVVLEGMIASWGLQTVWRLEAAAVLVVVVSIALALPRRRTRTTATVPTTTGALRATGPVWTLAQAMRTSMFWVLAAGVATSGMLGTALAFHQISVLGAQGLSPAQAAANFLPQTITGILATLLTGAAADRIPPKYGVTFAMATLAAALTLLPTVGPGVSAVLYGLVLGAATGSLRGLEAAAYVRYYGTTHIGAIRGVATAISLASTAIGPLLLSIGHDAAGDYRLPVLILAVLPAAVAVLSVFARTPRHPIPAR
ncbi:MFS transporter [Kocuria oceani]|uniref:MFS transporter n=1 Tax=Kocuria oceani TaxID=988827 RepID=UPI004036F700